MAGVFLLSFGYSLSAAVACAVNDMAFLFLIVLSSCAICY